jgi:hypothetical protein
VLALQADVRARSEVRAAIKKAESTFGGRADLGFSPEPD